jgi:ribosomal protein S18 acetylase RimI-like enzyme
MTIVPADTLDLAELAALFSAGYEGYFVPLHVDEAALTFMVGAWDIDLARSRIALRGDERIGVAMLGLRGERGWIGGLGVVPGARRSGVGRALMEAVLAEAPAAVSLEVIEQNEPAIRLYESLGFERTRILEVWSLSEEPPPATAHTVEPRPLGQAGLPWQRADESLPAEFERIEVEGASAVIRISGPRVSVLQLEAHDETAAEALLAAARARGESLHYVNVPEGDPASAAFEALGGKLDLRQFEMRTLVSA